MFKVLKYAKKLWYVVVLIFLLLIVQVYGELTLPQFTSDIVDVGIQNQGLEYPIPERISKETMDNLKLFMDDDVWSFVESCYKEGEEEYQVDIASMEKEQYEQLKDDMIVPELMLYFMTSDSEEAKAFQQQIKAGMASGMMTKNQEEQGNEMPAGEVTGQNMAELPLLDMMKLIPKEQLQGMLEEGKKQLEQYPEYM